MWRIKDESMNECMKNGVPGLVWSFQHPCIITIIGQRRYTHTHSSYLIPSFLSYLRWQQLRYTSQRPRPVLYKSPRSWSTQYPSNNPYSSLAAGNRSPPSSTMYRTLHQYTYIALPPILRCWSQGKQIIMDGMGYSILVLVLVINGSSGGGSGENARTTSRQNKEGGWGSSGDAQGLPSINSPPSTSIQILTVFSPAL